MALPKASLPPSLLIRTGKSVWTTLWHRMMAQMAPADKTGHYQRPNSDFRAWIAPDSPHPPAHQRYSLIVGLGCPWAHRTLVTRALKGLEETVSILPVEPSPNEGCWAFTTPFRGCRILPDLYRQVRPGYSGRSTVPVLWDRQAATIVNNESADIIVILNEALTEFATQPGLDLYPESLRATIDTWNDRIYTTVNNGVYRCGFAQTQAAYDQACADLFGTLADIEQTLTNHRYLCGEVITLADVRLFTTLVRFDAVYYSLFKCNRRRIQDYAALRRYLYDVYHLPGVAATCDLEAIKRDYYGNLFPLNPGGIIPAGPDLSYLDTKPEPVAYMPELS